MKLKRWLKIMLAGLACNPEIMRRWALAPERDRQHH